LALTDSLHRNYAGHFTLSEAGIRVFNINDVSCSRFQVTSCHYIDKYFCFVFRTQVKRGSDPDRYHCYRKITICIKMTNHHQKRMELSTETSCIISIPQAMANAQH